MGISRYIEIWVFREWASYLRMAGSPHLGTQKRSKDTFSHEGSGGVRRKTLVEALFEGLEVQEALEVQEGVEAAESR